MSSSSASAIICSARPESKSCEASFRTSGINTFCRSESSSSYRYHTVILFIKTFWKVMVILFMNTFWNVLTPIWAPAWWSSTGWVQCCVSSSCRTWAYCPSSAGSSCRLCSPRNSSCITLFYSYLFYYIIIQLFSILFIFFFLFFGFNNVACSNFQQRRREL